MNEGFSGGEKKKNEIFQMAMLDPKLANLDDISNQMLTAASGKQYRLGDIARVERGYACLLYTSTALYDIIRGFRTAEGEVFRVAGTESEPFAAVDPDVYKRQL